MNSNFFEETTKFLPFKAKRVYFNLMLLNDFLEIREKINSEPIDKLTCRPINIKTIEEAEKHFEAMKKNETSINLGIYLNNSNIIIGRVSIFDYNQRNQTVEIGYFILPEFRKMGYALEVIETLKYLIFEKLSINKVLAQTAEFNRDSITLLEKSGFSVAGILKEHHELNGNFHDDFIYYLLNSQYKNLI